MTDKTEIIEHYIHTYFAEPDDEFAHFHLDEGNIRWHLHNFIEQTKLQEYQATQQGLEESVKIEKGLIEACITHLVDYRESTSMCLSAFGTSKEKDAMLKDLDKTINSLKQSKNI